MTSKSTPLDLAFIGSGAIHFGGAEGPWDHSIRLEKIEGLRFKAIVDPDTSKAQSVLSQKLSGSHGQLYKDCAIYKSTDEMLAAESPSIVLLGISPQYRGSKEKGKDLELSIVSKGLNLFVEKPMSLTRSEAFEKYAAEVEAARKKNNVIVSVGYMFRYHAGVMKMRDMISAHGGKVMVLNARYYVAYSEMDHPFWWDINRSGGPIVEQATHFCDIARFLVGEIDHSSIHTTCLREKDEGGAGKLKHVKEICEGSIPVDKRVPRATISTWRFKEGGIGTLTHAVALHGKQYETSIEVLMDGLRLTLLEPYTTKCKLLVRQTGSDEEAVYDFGSDDPYQRELDTFIEAVKSKETKKIASSYEDAAKTYSFSWAVRLAEEESKK